MPYLFLAPYLILFGLFVLAPSVYVIWISLHDWDFLLPGKPFVGLQNYLNLFKAGTITSGPFWSSMLATGKFVLYSVPLLVTIPLAVAILLNQKFPGRDFFRAAFFAPYVLGVAVIGILWRFLLDPNIGLVNHYLEKIGIDNIPWTTETPGCGRPWSAQRSGGHSASTASSTWPASRTSRVSSTRRPGLTAPTPGTSSATSPSRGCARCWC